MPRPILVPKAAVILELVGLALFIVARTTGAGWDIVLLCGVIAVVITGSLLPALVLSPGHRRRPRARRRHRRPAAARSSSPCAPTHVKLQVLTFDSDWVRIDAPTSGPLVVTPTRRGVLRRIRVEVVTAAPLGLARWRRRIRVTLPTPVDVAPAPRAHALPDRRRRHPDAVGARPPRHRRHRAHPRCARVPRRRSDPVGPLAGDRAHRRGDGARVRRPAAAAS